MKPSVCFFTVCGGREDYDFLLGGIWHHAKMGTHLVLDTCLKPKSFRGLPSGVRWINEPIYGSGWKKFKLRTAVERAKMLALESKANILVYLDSDEFFSLDSEEWLFPLANDRAVEVKNVHWKTDFNPYEFGNSEWHLRVWPSKMDVQIARNEAWLVHPRYNGNPEHHPVPVLPKGVYPIRAHGSFHHHLHYAIGSKTQETEVAEATIQGWPDHGKILTKVDWPGPLALWRDKNIAPSSYFL